MFRVGEYGSTTLCVHEQLSPWRCRICCSKFRYENYLVFHVLGLIDISGSYGQLDFDASAIISSVCKANEVMIATVPAPPKDINILAKNTISYPLTKPLQSQISFMVQTHVQTIHQSWIQRIKEVVMHLVAI